MSKKRMGRCAWRWGAAAGLSLGAIGGCGQPETDPGPLAGFRHEETQIECGTSREVAPEVPIGELAFERDGRFSVTRHPFETYADYLGRAPCGHRFRLSSPVF